MWECGGTPGSRLARISDAFPATFLVRSRRDIRVRLPDISWQATRVVLVVGPRAAGGNLRLVSGLLTTWMAARQWSAAVSESSINLLSLRLWVRLPTALLSARSICSSE